MNRFNLIVAIAALVGLLIFLYGDRFIRRAHLLAEAEFSLTMNNGEEISTQKAWSYVLAAMDSAGRSTEGWVPVRLPANPGTEGLAFNGESIKATNIDGRTLFAHLEIDKARRKVKITVSSAK